MARPIIGKKKDHDIRVRIDADLYSELEEYCSKHDKKKAETIRRAIKAFLNSKKDATTAK
jgi:metal-responsive CopG/Arc/MetJ family transcriptional regulator